MHVMTYIFFEDTRVDAIVTAVARLIARGGLAALTMRNIAAEARVSQAGLAYDLTNRARLLHVSASVFGARLVTNVQPMRGAACLILGDAGADEADDFFSLGGLGGPRGIGSNGIVAQRIWLGFRELARSDADVAEVVAAIDRREQDCLRMVLEPTTGTDRILELHALSTGLRDAVCRTVLPMPLAAAWSAMVRQAADVARADDAA